MAENQKLFEARQRIEIDSHKHVLVVELRCPMCEAEGKTDPVNTPSTRTWRPNFHQLMKMAKTTPELNALFEETEKGKRARLVCANHGLQLRKAGIRTDMFHMVLERSRDRRKEQELGSIASILAGKKAMAADAESQGDEPQEEDAGAKARAQQDEVQRKLSASAKAKAKKEEAKAKTSTTKGRGQAKLQKEIEDGIAEAGLS